MSLIDDALKRAREEAARQDEALRREKRPWIPPPPEKLRSAGMPVVLAAASAVVLLGAAAWWVTRNRGATPRPGNGASAPRVPASPISAAPRTAHPPPVLETVEVPPPAGARPRTPEPSAAAPASAADASPTAPAPRARRASPAPAAAPPPQAGSAAAPAPERASRGSAAAALRDGSTFVRVADLPSGEKIELGGIVWSDTNPVAVIGGQLLSPGARIGDFQIVRIEENRVTLYGRGVTIYLTP